jgi:hypothetical protein
MAKFKPGDKCRITNNLLAPNCAGDVVTIDSIAIENSTAVLYRIIEEDIMGYAMERCLERIEND